MKVAGRAIVVGAMVCAVIGAMTLISFSSAEKVSAAQQQAKRGSGSIQQTRVTNWWMARIESTRTGPNPWPLCFRKKRAGRGARCRACSPRTRIASSWPCAASCPI